jgi:hypothetical protein
MSMGRQHLTDASRRGSLLPAGGGGMEEEGTTPKQKSEKEAQVRGKQRVAEHVQASRLEHRLSARRRGRSRDS